jgi:sodium-coupled neutral amino acid transporter 9
MNMFDSTDPIGFAVRLMLYLFLCCSFPIVLHLEKRMITFLVWGQETEVEDVPQSKFLVMNLFVMSFPLVFALFYPNVGSILSWTGSVVGVIMIYFIPVIIHLKIDQLKAQDRE